MSMTPAEPDLARQAASEGLGTLFLVTGVVGSGIMAQTLTHDVALALLCNTIATGALLSVLILIFAPISGAQFNPAVTLALFSLGEITASRAFIFVAAQIAGGVCGTFLAHAMFSLPILEIGEKARTGTGQWIGEGVATFGLLLTILGCRQSGARVVAAAVGLYIASAYWFTSSTSFANPAVTIARALTPTFAGIRPQDVPLFIAVQCAAALAAAYMARVLLTNQTITQAKP